MRLPRLTTRRLMAVVVVAALILGVWAQLDKRRVRLRRKALYHQNTAIRLNFEFATDIQTAIPFHLPEWGQREAERQRLFLLAKHHFALATKYEEASSHPWLPVPPDPPPPE